MANLSWISTLAKVLTNVSSHVKEVFTLSKQAVATLIVHKVSMAAQKESISFQFDSSKMAIDVSQEASTATFTFGVGNKQQR